MPISHFTLKLIFFSLFMIIFIYIEKYLRKECKMKETRSTILIVDDAAMNRALLSDLLSENYNILEAQNGNEAFLRILENKSEIKLILLDMVMPERDGLEVLDIMNKNGWIKDVPVVMISSETSPEQVEKAFSLGVTDFIYRPFDQLIVQNRVRNTIRLYEKQRQLSNLVANQIYEKTRNSSMLITVLSHIVEFRNGESGLHVLHINSITEILLHALLKRTKQYKISEEEIGVIGTASSMHDIGKITIPDEILNKPGRFTPEEFNVMKKHSMNGASMLDSIPFGKDEPLMKYAYEICRWHHERWDGRGYPDGLKGDDIPISAQIVSLADVYDALTSKRCYKNAFSHEEAIRMIKNNECGVFNPILIECLDDVKDSLEETLKQANANMENELDYISIAENMAKESKNSMYTQAFRQFTTEHKKCLFYESILDGITFEYTFTPSILKFNDNGAKRLNTQKAILYPEDNSEFINLIGADTWEKVKGALNKADDNSGTLKFNCELTIDGKKQPCTLHLQLQWNNFTSKPHTPGCAFGLISIRN